MDVYSLWESLEAIRDYLRKNNPLLLKILNKALVYFEPYGREGTDYATSTRFTPETCKKEIIDLLKKIMDRIPFYNSDHEAPFKAEQNAFTAVNAEKYYREMVKGGPGIMEYSRCSHD